MNLDPPSKSRIVIDPASDGFRIKLPTIGISRAGHGLFWVGVCFCVGCAVLNACFLLFPHLGTTHKGVYTPPDPTPEPLSWQVWAVLTSFWIVSLGLTLVGATMGMRRAIIDVSVTSVRIVEIGLFRRRHLEYKREEISAIQTGPSGMSVGATKRTGASGKSIQQLHIYLKNGRRIRLLTGRDDDELDWLAAQLRQALAVTTKNYDGQ
jgi:hypothetical protein